MLQRAAASSADLVFLDLEDSVAPSEKIGARSKIINALKTLDWGTKTKAIRMNNLETQWAYEDIIHVVEEAGEHLDIIIVPKVYRAEDVRWVDTLLTQIEKKRGWERRIGLEVLIEEVEAMINVDEIAKASPRVEALIFGPGDYSASQGVRSDAIGGVSDDYPGDVWHYQRMRIVIAARAAGIEAVDGPFPDYRDIEGYRRECRKANLIGFIGKWCIHPDQIPLANENFAPDALRVARARAEVAAYEQAEREGKGAVQYEGRMIDAATSRVLRNIIGRADAIGM
jgi:citrate lyase subunit beta/citryl-CoA lyase